LRLKQCHYFKKNQRLDGEVFAGGDFQAKPTYTKGWNYVFIELGHAPSRIVSNAKS
jgi:hypothetical protein